MPVYELCNNNYYVLAFSCPKDYLNATETELNYIEQDTTFK